MDSGLIYAAGMLALYVLPVAQIAIAAPPPDRPHRRLAALILLAMHMTAISFILDRALE